jgi:phage baseplate assembly protein V
VSGALDHLLRPIRTRIANLAARALVRLVNDGAKLQVVQLGVLAGETREGCERFQEYGFTSVPLAGAEAVVIFPGGSRDHGLVVAVDDRRYRKKDLQPGEVALYNNDGLFVLLKSGRAVVTAPELRLGSDAAANYVALANLVDTRVAALVSAFNAHTHTVTTVGSATTQSGTTVAPLPQIASQASVAAGKVKAE